MEAPAHQAVRQVDWRFLLADPLPGSVRAIPHADPLLFDAFHWLGTEVVDRDEPGQVGVVFARDPGRELARRSLELRSEDGTIVVETTTRRARWRAARQLRRAGLGISPYGCWPGCADATRFVPLDDRSELIASARAAKNRTRRRAGIVLARLGLGAQMFGQAILVATQRSSTYSAAPHRVAFGDELAGRGAVTLLTPRFGSSRHVIAMCRDDRGRRLVVKTPRVPGDDAQLALEARGLAAIQGAYPERPRLVLDTERLGQRWLVQTLVDGLPLTRRDVERDPERWLAAAQNWLERLPSNGRTTPDEDGRAERLIRPALELVGECAAREPALRKLVADAENAFEKVRTVPLPVVVEHGDFRPPNLIVTGPGRVAVVDWELAEPAGLPFHDLAFFHAFVVDVAPHTRADVRAAGLRAARSAGVDVDVVGPLRSIAMLRQLANLVERGTGDRSDAKEAQAVSRSDVALSWFAELESQPVRAEHGGGGS